MSLFRCAMLQLSSSYYVCHFLALLEPYSRLSSLNFALNFKSNKPNFCCLNVQLYYCAANQYNKIACKVQRNFSKISKNSARSVLMKLNLLRETLLVNLFALGSERESKYDERTPFWNCPRSLDLSLNPQATYMRFSGQFQFQSFFSTSCWFSNLQTKFIKFCTKFQVKQIKINLLLMQFCQTVLSQIVR